MTELWSADALQVVVTRDRNWPSGPFWTVCADSLVYFNTTLWAGYCVPFCVLQNYSLNNQHCSHFVSSLLMAVEWSIGFPLALGSLAIIVIVLIYFFHDLVFLVLTIVLVLIFHEPWVFPNVVSHFSSRNSCSLSFPQIMTFPELWIFPER